MNLYDLIHTFFLLFAYTSARVRFTLWFGVDLHVKQFIQSHTKLPANK